MHSRFNVMIECKRQTGGISPGMHVKLIIFFRCDILDEPEEMLVINVQQGRSVIIKLRGYRDSPILQMTSIPSFAHPRQKLQAKAMVKKKMCIAKILFTQTNSHEKFTDTSSNASNISGESILYCKKLKSFDCGGCHVDQQVVLSLMVKNIGGEGRFFIMSEIDWCSMHIEDVTNDNMLILPSFAIWPAYFTLKSQEYIYLHIYFFPDTHGMHVETLYAICDNCSVITTEMIGDGIAYKQQ
ncbi:Deleted in lung and esophageal cancer protein [Camponotus japonicus]